MFPSHDPGRSMDLHMTQTLLKGSKYECLNDDGDSVENPVHKRKYRQKRRRRNARNK